MLRTPGCFRTSIGEPSRIAARVRTQSPGSRSADSGENVSASSPCRRPGPGASSYAGGARRSVLSGTPTGTRHSRDPRPVGDRSYASQCARNVVEVLHAQGYGKAITHEKLLKDPSTREFFDVFRFLIAQLDPQLEVEGKMEDEVPLIMRRLRYPVEVNRSKLQAISGPNTWPQLLAVLDFLATLVRLNEELIDPVASCQLGLPDTANPEQQGDHQLLRSLHENYIQYLAGREDHSDEERLRRIYEERSEALRGEIGRLQEQQLGMEKQVQEFHAEHERLQELLRAPPSLETEAERLRASIQSVGLKVQKVEEELSATEDEERKQLVEIEELRSKIRQLTELVESQAYSKKDIERLKCERGHLRRVVQDLRADAEKAEQDVWELGMQESTRAETIGRLVRATNDCVEALEPALAVGQAETSAQDLKVRIYLNEPTDALAAQDFQELFTSVQSLMAAHGEAAQSEETALHGLQEEQRAMQGELAEKEREGRHLKARLEQLNKMREEYRLWSAAQLDDAQRTAEVTEDAVHAAAIGSNKPSLRDAAEVDRIRLTKERERVQFANEKAQLLDEIRRDEERFEEKKLLLQEELSAFAKAQEALCRDVEAALQAGGGDFMTGDGPCRELLACTEFVS